MCERTGGALHESQLFNLLRPWVLEILMRFYLFLEKKIDENIYANISTIISTSYTF